MNNGRNTLWYREPAHSWNESLPLGNGRLGAMVFGGITEERVALNEDTLWTGYPSPFEPISGSHILKLLKHRRLVPLK